MTLLELIIIIIMNTVRTSIQMHHSVLQRVMINMYSTARTRVQSLLGYKCAHPERN